MTRFLMDLKEAVELVLFGFENVKTGDNVIKVTKISKDKKPEKRIPKFSIGKRFENYYDHKINSLEERIKFLENKLGE